LARLTNLQERVKDLEKIIVKFEENLIIKDVNDKEDNVEDMNVKEDIDTVTNPTKDICKESNEDEDIVGHTTGQNF
jgi:hypothetical protein